MPQYRKLYAKICESFDVNDLPNDFSRLTWVLLPLHSCREGRGYADDRWLHSKLFPLRTDIRQGQCIEALQAMHDLGMLTVYTVNGRPYYQITKWEEYQGNTSKEADSQYPSPQEADDTTIELVRSGSGVSQPQMQMQYSDADADADAETRPRKREASIPDIPPELDTDPFREIWQEWKQHRREKRSGLKPTTAKGQLKKLAGWGQERAIAALRYSIDQGYTGIFEPDPTRVNAPGQPRTFKTKDEIRRENNARAVQEAMNMLNQQEAYHGE